MARTDVRSADLAIRLAMADPTSKEIARLQRNLEACKRERRTARKALEACREKIHSAVAAERQAMEERDIPEAVEVERERCATIFPEKIDCPACYVESGEACVAIAPPELICKGIKTHPHSSRYTAAIRRAPEPGAEEEE